MGKILKRGADILNVIKDENLLDSDLDIVRLLLKNGLNGISQSQISRWRNNACKMSFERVVTILEHAGLQLSADRKPGYSFPRKFAPRNSD